MTGKDDAVSGCTSGVSASTRTKWRGLWVDSAHRHAVHASMELDDRTDQREQILSHQLRRVEAITRNMEIDEVQQREEQGLAGRYGAFVTCDIPSASGTHQ